MTLIRFHSIQIWTVKGYKEKDIKALYDTRKLQNLKIREDFENLQRKYYEANTENREERYIH